MKNWRTLPTQTLTSRAEALEERGDWALAEEIWEELEERDSQAAANSGAMNGKLPGTGLWSYQPPERYCND